MTDRFIVIADPPTPNGDLHVGHLSGPYFAADVLTRSLRLRGAAVAFFSNFDGRQPYVATAARRLGVTPEQVVARFEERIAATLAAYAVEPDFMGRPDAAQGEFVSRFFADLLARGALLVKDWQLPYCDGCARYLFEAYLQGTCPHCGEGCYGNGCEACGLPNEPAAMGSPLCRLCGQPPAGLRSYRGLFLPLSRTRDDLAAYLATREGIWRPHLLELLLGALARPLPDIPLTYPTDYGLPVDLPGFAGQVWNVRQEILPALLHTFDCWRERQGAAGWHWRDEPGARVVCCHGYENGFQYGASFNSQLLASPLGWGPIWASVSNEFYLLDGRKFSTTRSHAVWGADLLARVPCDPVRFYLALTNPETAQTNFVLGEFRDTVDRRLTAPWNLLHEQLGRALAAPGCPAGARPVPDEYAARLDEVAQEVQAALTVETFSLIRAARAVAGHLEELAARAERLPSAGAGELSAVLAGLKALALFAEPLVPRFAARLQECLQQGLATDRTWGCYRSPIAPAGVCWGEDLRMRPVAALL